MFLCSLPFMKCANFYCFFSEQSKIYHIDLNMTRDSQPFDFEEIPTQNVCPFVCNCKVTLHKLG